MKLKLFSSTVIKRLLKTVIGYKIVFEILLIQKEIKYSWKKKKELLQHKPGILWLYIVSSPVTSRFSSDKLSTLPRNIPGKKTNSIMLQCL